MKIVCTTKEFAELIRGCEKGSCQMCAMNDICGTLRIESAVEFEICEKGELTDGGA